MASRYASTEAKIKGIQQQPYIIRKVIDFLRNKGYKVEVEITNANEDRNLKIDYILKFDPSTPFNGKLELKIDVKYAATLTVISDAGVNVIQKSTTDYIILNNPYSPNELLWINTRVLQECLKRYPPVLIDSYEKGNFSKFMRIKKYMNEHKDVFGNTSKTVLL